MDMRLLPNAVRSVTPRPNARQTSSAKGAIKLLQPDGHARRMHCWCDTQTWWWMFKLMHTQMQWSSCPDRNCWYNAQNNVLHCWCDIYLDVRVCRHRCQCWCKCVANPIAKVPVKYNLCCRKRLEIQNHSRHGTETTGRGIVPELKVNSIQQILQITHVG